MKGNFKRTLVLAAASVILGAMWLGATPASASHCNPALEDCGPGLAGSFASMEGGYYGATSVRILNTHRVYPDPDPPPQNNITISEPYGSTQGGGFQSEPNGRLFVVSEAPYRIEPHWYGGNPGCVGLYGFGAAFCQSISYDPHPTGKPYPASTIFVDTHSQDDTVTIQRRVSVPATVNTYEGDDIVNVANGVVGDTVDCGPGEDTVIHDAGDTHTNCESAQEL